MQMRMPHDPSTPVSVRIGVHTGPCVSGLIGTHVPKWTVLGDTINTSARLEQVLYRGATKATSVKPTPLHATFLGSHGAGT
ncbi:hypothetical protein V8C86DRAFT_1788596 [Haematococcus lacustris]